MMDAGTIVKDDPEILALELTAPATILISRSDRQPKYGQDIQKIIENMSGIFAIII